MRNVFLCVVMLGITLVSSGALYDPPSGPEPPTYNIAELNQMVNWLEDYYGACTTIFVEEGGQIELCEEAKRFTKLIETHSIQILQQNPSYNASQWSNAVYAQYSNWFSSSRWQDMFSELTQPQLNVLLYKVVYWNPDEDPTETRTFDTFKTWVLSQ